MVILAKLKLNRFKPVSIPRNRDYFRRFGFSASPDKAFSGDEELPGGNKTDVLQQMQRKLEKEVESSD